jgi:hypothetical protein
VRGKAHLGFTIDRRRRGPRTGIELRRVSMISGGSGVVDGVQKKMASSETGSNSRCAS